MSWQTSKRKALLVVVVMITSTLWVQAQYDLNDKMPLNPHLQTGKLANGLTYYIMNNPKPEQKVELRLVVNAGSICEDPDQLGLAHMAEHMAFNGTKNFKKNEIVSFLQDIGVGFGNDLNAYTSFDETVYILPIPTDKPDNLEKGFQVLEDWAHNVTYKDDDIDGERPIILEESRLGKGANERMFKKILPKLFKGSLYADRLPIGKDSIIKTFKYDAIRRFYHDWYRPDLMAVLVVGDIKVEDAEALIRKHFSGLTNPPDERERKYASVPAYDSSDALVTTDKESVRYQTGLEYPAYKQMPSVTYGDYRKDLVKDLFTTMLNRRMQELTQKENPPFVFANASFGGFARGYENFSVSAGSGDQPPARALQAAVEEVERVKRFGFTAAELERAKKSMTASYERMYNDRDKTESYLYVEEFIRNFLQQEPIPGIEKEYYLVQNFVPTITLQEVNSVADKMKGQQDYFAYLMGPEKTDVQLPSGTDLLTEIAQVEKKDIKPYEEKAIASQLLKTKPRPGMVISESQDAKTGTTELKLSNGITVTLKPTDFKNDQILMSASRYGGTSNYGVADKYNAAYAVNVVNAMGFGEFSPTDLQKILSGKSVSANPILIAEKEGMSGSSTVKDLETMFQLAYLKFTEPRKDTSLFKSFIQKNKSQYALIGANPQAAFIDTVMNTLYNGNPLAPIAVPKSSYFEKVNLNRAFQIYKERLGDLSGMNFVFVGSFRKDSILPLIKTYIASLPATGKKTSYVDQKVRPVNGRKKMNVYKGKDEKSLILTFYSGEVPFSEDLELKAKAITEVLNIRVIEELREKIQGIYGGGIFGGLEKTPYPGYQFVVQLPCGPEKVDTLLKAMQNEVDDIMKNGPSQKNLDKVKQQWREAHKDEIKQNAPWMNHLIGAKVEGENIDRFVNYDQYIDKLTVKDLQEAARLLLSGKNRFTAVMMPESYADAATTTANRNNKVVETIQLTSPEIKVDLYDNAEVDGDEVTLYFNGNKILTKYKLTDKPYSIKLKAEKGQTNELVMFADNLGTVPPNTAYMRVSADGKIYQVRVDSDLKTNGSIRFKIK